MSQTTGLCGRLTINLDSIVKNWRALDHVSGGALTGAVVKANAYGTGLEQAGVALSGAGAQFFFVATPDEGIALRKVLPAAHIFILNGLYPGAGKTYLEHGLMPILCAQDMLEEWMALCTEQNEAFPAALHFDTGINRLGFRMRETEKVREQLDNFGYLPQMLMSHLACADQPSHEKNRTQLALFQTIMGHFPGIPASLANSAGLMTGREYHFQMVRPGVALFGGRAVSGRANPMSPVVTLEVPVLQVRDASIGETVGYGATQNLNRDSRLAILAVGYADGFLRSLSSTSYRPAGKVAYKGRILPVVGRVSMDMISVDLTELGDDVPRPGEMMEVIGPTITVDDQADRASTIGYEILTSLKGRYERVYIEPKSKSEA